MPANHMPRRLDTTDKLDRERHWDEMTVRIVARATSRRTGLGWLAQSNARWAATIALAAACALLALSPRSSAPNDATQGWASVIAPTDAAFRAVALRDRPPAIGGLLLAQSLSGGRP